MSDKGEKTCPLCTEEMDLTDRQLKPCKCGYDICVWCWHHIMDMAEKDNSEGRCPACRTPYDKEKIVGMAADCERLVAEINLERKQKLQKAKPKASEGRKHLSDVRVIQRNLVNIMGLPLNLADEVLLQRKEYFGQYGKVLKVSIARTASGVIQHSSSNSFSVYVTYLKEEEAVRCIQSVHNFVLEGRSLRACFGTTKYCHAWLRSLPCSNPDCLYLHEFGSQEDSFTKDEIVSAFARSRVQQIIAATNNSQRHSGNVLPPPADEYRSVNISSMVKPVAKISSNNTGSQHRRFCQESQDSRNGSSIVLPAGDSWVMRVSSSQPPVPSLSGSSAPAKQKPGQFSGPLVLPSEVVSTQGSSYDVGNRPMIAEERCEVCEVHPNDNLDSIELTNQYIGGYCQAAEANVNAEVILDATPANVMSTSHLSSMEGGGDIAGPPTFTSSVELAKQSCSPGSHKDGNLDANEKVQSLSSGLSSISIQSHVEEDYSVPVIPDSLVCNYPSIKLPGNQHLQLDDNEKFREPSTSQAFREATTAVNVVCVPKDEDLQAFEGLRLSSSEGIHHSLSVSCSSSLLHILNQSSSHSWHQGKVCDRSNLNADPRNVLKHGGAAFPFASSNSASSNGFNDNKANSFPELDFACSDLFSDVESRKCIGSFDDEVVNAENNLIPDMGESNIISNILSLDLDAWDDPLTSLHSVKLLNETDKQQGYFKLPSLLKVRNSCQSRFSFAREEDYASQHLPTKYHGPQVFMEKGDSCLEKCQNIVLPSSFAESDNIPCCHSFTSANKLFAVPRARVSAPPGFSVPSRTPPPGFSSHERVDHAFNSYSVNNLLQTCSVLGGHFQGPATGNAGSSGDINFIDPAILEVGKGILTTGLNNSGLDMRPSLPQQFSLFEHEARLQLLMQQSISAQQNQIFSGHLGNRVEPPDDTISVPSMLIDQSQARNASPFAQLTSQQYRNSYMSNGHWSSWNEVKGLSGWGMSEFSTNERLGFSKCVPGFEDLEYQMAGTGDIYNRGFRM